MSPMMHCEVASTSWRSTAVQLQHRRPGISGTGGKTSNLFDTYACKYQHPVV